MFKDLTNEEVGFLTSRLLLDGAMFTSYDADEESLISSLIQKGYIEEIYQGYYPYYQINQSRISLASLLNITYFPMSVTDNP